MTTVVMSRGGDARKSGAIREVLVAHLGETPEELPVAAGAWPPYDHVNVQVALDYWLRRQPGEHRLLGLTGFRHRMFGLADLLLEGMDAGMATGGVAQVEM